MYLSRPHFRERIQNPDQIASSHDTMLDEEPVIISAKDFAPTPSPSPSAEIEANRVAAGGVGLPPSSTTSWTPYEDGETEILPPGSDSPESMSPVPTAEDVSAVDELGLSLTRGGGGITTINTDNSTNTTSASAAAATATSLLLNTTVDDSTHPEVPSARQIVSIGNVTDLYAFKFHEDELNAILVKIPPGWKVCVVSVVGAFRTGKSFLLSWFLRYLEAHCVRSSTTGTSGSSSMGYGEVLSDIADNEDSKKWFERVQTLNQHEGSFDWRGGKERNTTGMWMWSDPYFLPRPSKGDEVAILLVDTQGMFDHETTVGLTAAIFGLSTLLSSYQIYNVDKRIQEDNLQQLALFSEYGRMAFEAEEKAASMGMISEKEGGTASRGGDDAIEVEMKGTVTKVKGKQPFQKIEFLVRDWQNFDTEDESDIAAMEAEMMAYLEHVTAERAASDLKDTRDQITSCFEDVGCYMMTHPGFTVIKNKYEGDVSKIEPLFMRLLDRYCQRVFDTHGMDGAAPRLAPKTIRGRELSAVELGSFIKSYAQMFEEIGANFPKAETMLEATSKANNATAINASVETYTELMNSVAGPKAMDYHRPDELLVKHKEASSRALKAFEEIANFGNRNAIEEAKAKVMAKIAKDYEVFLSLNEGRNPLLGFET
jgi:atlastin